MAQYNLGSAGDISSIDDFHKVQQYLYRMNENLRYMFNNLTPEDNYSEEARLTYVSDGERQSSIETTIDHINLQMVDKDEVVSAINMSREQIKILAEKIQMEGLVTVNSYFQIGLDGSITARNGKFSGNITASTMNSSAITLGGNGLNGSLIVLDTNDQEIGHWNSSGFSVRKGVIDMLWGTDVGVYADGEMFQVGDFVVDPYTYGRSIFQSVDQATGMSAWASHSGFWFLWAGYNEQTDTAAFAVDDNGKTIAQTLIIGTPGVATGQVNVGEQIGLLWSECARLQDEIDSIDDGGGE